MYQINIDNYTRALTKIDPTGTADDAVSVAIREHGKLLEKALITEKVEQAKSQLILDAINEQLPPPA